MKHIYCSAVAILLAFPGYAQFQRQFGTALDEAFTKVIRSGTNYYVLGTAEAVEGQTRQATVTRLNALGELQWTRSLTTGSRWNDAVLTPNGDLLVVGQSMPDDNTSRSIMGLITAAGSFTWVRSYDIPNRDAFTKIVRNPAPQNANFPYYVLGHQLESLPAKDDVFLMNIDESGNINWKKIFLSMADDKFANDLEALANGDMIIAGHQEGYGVIFRVDKNGVGFNAVTPTNPYNFIDVTPASGGGFIALGYSFQEEKYHLIKFDPDLINQWNVAITNMEEASNVWQVPSSGDIMVTARRRDHPYCHYRFTVNEDGPTLSWVKYLDNGLTDSETAYSTFLSPNQIAYVDGRPLASGGFGGHCAFISVSDLELNTCMTQQTDDVIQPSDEIFNGPLIPNIEFYDAPMAANQPSAARTWQQGEACQAVCNADFSFQFPNCDPTVSFTNLSTGTGTLSYFWDFGYSVSGIPVTSTATNPVVTFPAQCATYNVCLTVTTPGCSNTICKNISIKYPQTPVLTCPPNTTVACNTNITPNITGLATLTGACSGGNATISYSDAVSGAMPCNGTVIRTFTATDECNVVRTCMQTILVQDNVPPVASCVSALTVTLDASCTASVTPADINNGSTDNCQLQSGNVSPSTFTQCGTYTVTLTVADKCNNSSSCTTNVMVKDNVAPTIMCPQSLQLACGDDISPSVTGMATATDNCDPAPVINFSDVVTGSLPCNAVITRTWTATDNCINTTSCVQTITVFDNIPPTISCPSNATIVASPPNCSIAIPNISYFGAADNCGTPNVTYTISGATNVSGTGDASGTIFNLGTSTVIYTATDQCNNATSCSFVITIQCGTAICCPEFSLIQLDSIMPCPGDIICNGDSVAFHNPTLSPRKKIACKNSTHTYYIVPNLPGFTYSWTITGGTPASFTGNPGIITWGNNDEGLIQVIITDATGTCKDTILQEFCLLDSPIAGISVSPGTILCTNEPVTFTNASVGANTYFWDFGDGTSSTLPNPPPHSYPSPGTYTVVLTVSNGATPFIDIPLPPCGCIDTAKVVITVLPGTGPTIVPSCKKMLCPGDTASYCVIPACAPINWTVNGGTITANNGSCITVKWDTPPVTFPASVSVTTGCSSACGSFATLNVPVLWNNIPITGPDPVCVGDIETYSLPIMPGTFYVWSVSSGGSIIGPSQNTPTITVKWNGPVGTQTISCNYMNPYSGCNGSTMKTIHVRDRFEIIGTTPICAGFTGSYNATTGISAANWTISPATGYTVTGPTTNTFGISVNWTTPGNYTITATPTNSALFCNPNSTIQVTVDPVPVITITGAATICPNQLINYSAGSSPSGGSFSWTLTGTGGTVSPYGSNNSNASVTFTGSGPWMLTVTKTINGCTGSATLAITAEPRPTLPPGQLSACIGGQIMVMVASGNGPFTWSSSPAVSLINGQGSNKATYEVHDDGTITVSNCGGKSNAITVMKTTPPVVQIQQTGLLCTANAQLVATAGGVNYTWYGGGTPVPPNALDVTKPGTYSVQVEFPGGCKSVASFTVLPEVVPTVTISTSDPLVYCIPMTYSVNLQALTQTGCTYQWYSIGPIPGATGPTYAATAAGSYYVEIHCGPCVATSNVITVYEIQCTPTTGGCAGMSNPLGTINVGVPAGNPPNQCNPKEFSVPVSNCPGGVVTWLFGDGSLPVTGNPVIHQYTQPGAYGVSASITCNNCTYVAKTSVNIPVIADFNSSVVCGANGSYTITFNNISQILGGWTFAPSTDVVWSSNCGSPSAGSGNTFILNTTPGCQPTVTMDITVNDGATPPNICTDTKTITLNLPTAPLSITGPTTVCKNQTYQFFSSMTGSNIIQYQWKVNNIVVSQVNPLSYAFDGNTVNPMIELTVTDVFGCTYTASTTLMVVMPNALSINPVKICPDCMPPAALTATPASGFANYQWYYNGNAISGATASTYQLCQPYTTGNYYVTAEDTQHNNCLVTSDTVQVTYHPKPDAAIVSKTIQCVSGTGPYSFYLYNAAGSIPGNSYTWTATGPGAVTFSPNNTQHDANASVTTLGTYEFILTVTDNTTGCIARDTFCVYLYPEPSVTVSSPAGTLCANTPYTFTASAAPPGNYVYSWNNGAYGPVMTTSQAGQYTVTAVNQESGCSGNAQTGSITPSPSAILFPCGCDTICDTETITPPLALYGGWPGNITGYNIQWFLNGNYTTPFYTGPFLNLAGNIAPPLVYGLNNISIVVTYQGCTDTSEVYNLFIKECCECSSNLTLNYGGETYPVSCDPHVGFIPSLGCPNDDVIISGFFGFVNPTTGEPCDETPVIWEFIKPNGDIQSGSSTNFTNFIFLKDSIAAPGLYCLSLSTVSQDGLDTCVCKVTWIKEPCDCCTTLEDFCNRLENNVSLNIDNNLCKVTVSVDNLPPCDEIEWINWGDLNQDPGPPNGGMVMHTYPGPGTYTICYLAIERDTNGMICFEKTICDTITVECPDCYCGTFSGLNFVPFIRNIQVTPVFCDSPEVTVGCPAPGAGMQFSGSFQCAGPNCPATAQITWALYRLPNTITPVTTGSTSANPYFGISILPAWYATPGSYELRLVGHCGQQECPCVVKFHVNCPDPCPCDVDQLEQDVAKGFVVTSSGVSCKACFTPIAINYCDMVTWHIGSSSNPPIGMSIGKQTFCHSFTNGGTYTIFMVVTRKRSDGSICGTFVKSQTFTLLCTPLGICTESVLDNPGFSIDAVGGILGQMGATSNWAAAAGAPVVLEGATGLDAWSISLSGNYDATDALMPAEPLCIERTEGMITLRAKDMSGGGRPRPCDRIVVALDNDWLLDDATALAQIDLSALDWGEWYDIQIPYNLADWMALESCGDMQQGARIQPIVYTTNALLDAQGGADTRSTIQVDYWCMDGHLLTGTNSPSQRNTFRLYPNPTTGALALEWVNTDVKNGFIQLTGPLGQTLHNWPIPHGAGRMEVQLDDLPGGMYFVKLISDGRLVAVRKVVRQ